MTGKGSKTRTVPVGGKARTALKAWTQVRTQLAAPEEKALFVGARGRRIAPGGGGGSRHGRGAVA